MCLLLLVNQSPLRLSGNSDAEKNMFLSLMMTQQFSVCMTGGRLRNVFQTLILIN